MIVSARRAPRIHRASRSQRPGIVLGLRYERRFVRTLRETLAKSANHQFEIEHNPWFIYTDSNGISSACSPDVLLHDRDSCITWVIEVKYTWVPDAFVKLKKLYCPVVEKALSVDTEPLVLVNKLTPDAPFPRLEFLSDGPSKTFQWIEGTALRLQ